MSRNYRYILGLITAEKNRYQRCLDLVWPGFCDVIDYASDSSLAVVIGLRHPSLVRTSRGVIKAIGTHKLGRISADEFASRVVSYSKSHVLGVSPDSYAVRETAESAERLAELKKTVASLLEEMDELASMLPGYALLKTVPAVSDISAVRLMAEIGLSALEVACRVCRNRSDGAAVGEVDGTASPYHEERKRLPQVYPLPDSHQHCKVQPGMQDCRICQEKENGGRPTKRPSLWDVPSLSESCS